MVPVSITHGSCGGRCDREAHCSDGGLNADVVYEDRSARNDIKGHAPSLARGLAGTLQKRAIVVSMNEFKLYSQRHQSTLFNAMHLRTTRSSGRGGRAKGWRLRSPAIAQELLRSALLPPQRERNNRHVGTAKERAVRRGTYSVEDSRTRKLACKRVRTVNDMFARKVKDATVETVEILSSSSESEVDTSVKSRPKLSTRRRNVLEKSYSSTSDSSDIPRPTKRRREASQQIQYLYDNEEEEDDEEEDEEEEEEDEEDADQFEAVTAKKRVSTRRSGRKRKVMQSAMNLSDDDYDSSSDDEEIERVKAKTKAKKKAATKSKAKDKSKRKNSSSDSSENEFDDSDEDDADTEAKQESDGFVIEKVLGREVHTLKEWKKICWNKNTRFLTHCSIFLPEEEEEKEKHKHKEKVRRDDDEIDDVGEERFLIKWKLLSYLHTSWQTEEELLETDKNAKGKLQRFREKEHRALYAQSVQGDEYFNPEFRSVDRILDIRDRPLDDFFPDDPTNDDSTFQYCLVKWKALPYDDITWEREDDVGDDAAIKLYNERILRAAKRFKTIALSKHSPKSKRKNFRGYTARSPPPYKKEQNFQLRDYQLTGINWMLFNWYQKRNSMLADEMGLGKTVQTVMYVNHLAVVEQTPRPFIIIAPLSTLGHWQREFDSWTNLNAVVYHGSAAARQALQKHEFFLSEDELLRAEELSGKKFTHNNGKLLSLGPKRNCYRFDVLITTYEVASSNDHNRLNRIDWQLMVVDEAHRLKNRNSKLSNILRTRFTFRNMLLLTGTPLQNNVEELWVLLNFLDTTRFESKEDFLERFGELTDSAQVERLHSELKPYLLRRMKEDVEKSLAPKEETIIEVELTVLQKQYYRAIYEMNTEFLLRGGTKGDIPNLMNVCMELRKCCNHPFLVKGVEEREVKRLASQSSKSNEEIEQQISESLVNTSGKLILLDKLLPRLKETGHRVLIFSQFKIMLDIIQDYLALRQYNCERIDGNITGNERQTAIDRFCRKDSNAFIMLLSTRAGGVGINLTAADTVIIYDSDWNPQNDLQAQARCHRIGQKKSVKIYRLLSSKTYELHMFHKASLKLGLDQAVLGGIRNDDHVVTLRGAAKTNKPNDRMSKEEIESLLKHGAYEIFKEQESEAEEASKKFGEESIDQILSRSTTIVHDPIQDADGNGKRNIMSSFSKATFVSSSNPDEEVDVDDPNFWTKVIGLKGVEEHKKEEPSPLQKRRCRRKVKSYVTDDDNTFMMEDSGDEGALSLRKKLFLGADAQRDEEFVISGDEEDDDSSGAEVAGDGLSDVTLDRKKKRFVLPIYSHTERIAELVGSFGYGRWKDMKRCAPILEAYPDSELSKFVQDYVATLVRVTIAITAFQRIGMNLEPSQVYIVSTTAYPLSMGIVGPMERYAQELTNFCHRYRFLFDMLKDMNATNLLAVAIPPRMWITDFKSRAARGSRTKLQQIDVMHKLSKFVNAKLTPMSPLVSLIKDLQKVGDEAEVHRMIESGIIPEPSDAVRHEKTEAVDDKRTETLSNVSSVKTFMMESSGNKDTDKNDDTSTGNKHPPSTDQAQTVAPAAIATSATNAESRSVNSSPSKLFGLALSENAASKSANPESVSMSIPTTKEGSSDNTRIEKSNTANTHESNARPHTSSVDAVPIVAPKAQTNDITAANGRTERKQAMQMLQALAPVSSSEVVAPWWISRVDDVLLMIHVYLNGWMKGRTLLMKMADGATLFGDRANQYPSSQWPTPASLNRRLKTLLHVWTTVKKMKPAAPPLTLIAQSMTFTKQPLMQRSQQEQIQPQQCHQQRQQRTQRVILPSRAPFYSSRHNRFAKLLFSYGIPDVSTCRDNRERNEKWRYFLQDSHLNIGHSPLTELLAEALDLERVCRLRLRNTGDGLCDREFGKENSILGGKRGFWPLTVTQCRRLLHRVDLFRLLRTQILVLPPAQLVELVRRVVQVQATSTDYPSWWSCPRHDTLLLQGVECYGLDEHLASVWKLPLFSSANPRGAFPSSSWVENYVTALALACQNLIAKSRSYLSKDAYVGPSKAEASSTSGRQYTISEVNEVRRRIHDIHGMREEDPYLSVRVRTIWATQVKEDEINAARKRSETSRNDGESCKLIAEDKQVKASERSDKEKEKASPLLNAGAIHHVNTRLQTSLRHPAAAIAEPQAKRARLTPRKENKTPGSRSWDVIVIDSSDSD